MPGIIWHFPLSSRDDDLLIASLLVVKIGLVSEMTGVGLEIKSFRPCDGMKCREEAKKCK
jgi:hypothetical protein